MLVCLHQAGAKEDRQIKKTEDAFLRNVPSTEKDASSREGRSGSAGTPSFCTSWATSVAETEGFQKKNASFKIQIILHVFVVLAVRLARARAFPRRMQAFNARKNKFWRMHSFALFPRSERKASGAREHAHPISHARTHARVVVPRACVHYVLSTRRESCRGRRKMTEAVTEPLEEAKIRSRMKQGISSPKRSTHCVCFF